MSPTADSMLKERLADYHFAAATSLPPAVDARPAIVETEQTESSSVARKQPAVAAAAAATSAKQQILATVGIVASPGLRPWALVQLSQLAWSVRAGR